MPLDMRCAVLTVWILACRSALAVSANAAGSDLLFHTSPMGHLRAVMVDGRVLDVHTDLLVAGRGWDPHHSLWRATGLRGRHDGQSVQFSGPFDCPGLGTLDLRQTMKASGRRLEVSFSARSAGVMSLEGIFLIVSFPQEVFAGGRVEWTGDIQSPPTDLPAAFAGGKVLGRATAGAAAGGGTGRR